MQAYTCWTYTQYKGDNYSLGLLFHNYGTAAADTFTFKLKLEADNYTDYNTWVNQTYLGTSLTAGASSWCNITVPKVFEGTSDYLGTTWDGWFALNAGDYKIAYVYAFGSDWGYTLSSPFNKEFTILQNLTCHKVFVVAILFDNINTLIFENHFDGIESGTIHVENEQENGWINTTFSTYCSTEFITHAISANSNTSAITGEIYWAKQEAKNELNLSNDWSNGIGTKTGNSGFDLLVVYVDSDVASTGYVGTWSNSNIIFITYSEWVADRVILHEVLHTYMFYETWPEVHGNIEHLEYEDLFIKTWNSTSQKWDWDWNSNYELHGHRGSDQGGGYIMGGPASWYMHPDTETRIWDGLDIYDGF